MKKERKNAGFSLIEMLCAILILVFLIMGIGVGMDAGSRIYADATFEADSATLAGILNTSLGDILRYSVGIREPSTTERMEHELHEDKVKFLFTSYDYGIQKAYFYYEGSDGVLQMKNLVNNDTVELVNTGAYPDLMLSSFSVTYTPRVAPGIEGGYFTIRYTITSKTDSAKERNVESIVRLMND